MKRRDFTKYAFGAIGGTALLQGAMFMGMRGGMAGGMGMAGAGCGGGHRGSRSNPPNTDKRGLLTNEPLFIPQLLTGTDKNRDGVKHFDLEIQKQQHNFYKDYKTNTFGISQSCLGKTILLQNGDKASINYTNKLDENTTMHGHGMHVPAKMDGGAHQIIKPNETWQAKYTVKQHASTNWYHPHLMGKTAEHVYQGLSGMIIVKDPNENLGLPDTYGEDDIVLIIQDRQFVDHQLDYNPGMRDIMMGYIGDVLITNAGIEPKLDVKAGVIRFRLLNGSNASLYKFSFDDNSEFYQIATDNALLEKKVAMKELVLSPSERAEIIIDFSKKQNKTIKLMCDEQIRGRKYTALSINVSNTQGAIIDINTINNVLNASLQKADSAYVTKVARTRNFVLGGARGSLTINGKSMNMNRIDEKIKLDEVEIWHVKNNMRMHHNFHMHATHFIPYKRNGKTSEVKENEKGYKDCIHIPPGESVDLLVKMTDYTDAQGAYMFHCHFLEHEDAGMMGQFVVVN